MKLLAAQELVNVQATEVADVRVSFQGGDKGRQIPDADPSRQGIGNQQPHPWGRKRWDGHDHQVHRTVACDLGELINPAQHSQSLQPLGGGMVIQEANGSQTDVGHPAQLAGHCLAGLTGPHDQAPPSVDRRHHLRKPRRGHASAKAHHGVTT
jgi:hypothetical protein